MNRPVKLPMNNLFKAVLSALVVAGVIIVIAVGVDRTTPVRAAAPAAASTTQQLPLPAIGGLSTDQIENYRSVVKDFLTGFEVDAVPPFVKTVVSTRGAFELLVQSAENVERAGDMVVVGSFTGSFTANSAHRPPGAEPPRGTTIILSWDPVTGQLNEWNLSDRQLDMQKLGMPTNVPLQ